MKVEPTRVHLICETKTTQFRISARIYRFPGFKLERYGTMWAPPVLSWFINPMNYSYLRTINHSYWSYVHQLSYPTGAPHCRWSQTMTFSSQRPKSPRDKKNSPYFKPNVPQHCPNIADSTTPKVCRLNRLKPNAQWCAYVFYFP
jgi:hypothetical protein